MPTYARGVATVDELFVIISDKLAKTPKSLRYISKKFQNKY